MTGVMRFLIATVALFLVLATSAPATPPERWVALSNTAMSITGDATFTSSAIAFAAGGRLAIRYLKDVPGSVSFVGTAHPHARGRLYRVLSPADLTLRSHNQLCGRRPTFVTVLKARAQSSTDVFLTVYSGSAEPVGKPSDNFCAGYTFTTT